jgi:hypothetical protein
LSVVHGIVAEHGGALTVESALGKGSVFRVLLPLAETSNDAPDRFDAVFTDYNMPQASKWRVPCRPFGPGCR